MHQRINEPRRKYTQNTVKFSRTMDSWLGLGNAIFRCRWVGPRKQRYWSGHLSRIGRCTGADEPGGEFNQLAGYITKARCNVRVIN